MASFLFSILYPRSSLSHPPRMDDEHKIDRADQIDKGTGRIGYLQRSAPQSADHILDGQFCRLRDAGVVGAKSVELMRVRRRDERLAETLRNFHCPPIRIEEAAPEMAELDRIETIDMFQQSISDRTADDVKGMRRNRKE